MIELNCLRPRCMRCAQETQTRRPRCGDQAGDALALPIERSVLAIKSGIVASSARSRTGALHRKPQVLAGQIENLGRDSDTPVVRAGLACSRGDPSCFWSRSGNLRIPAVGLLDFRKAARPQFLPEGPDGT